MTEEWKPVKGYEGLYEVSSNGRVRSLDRVAKNGCGTMIHKGKELSLCLLKNGYFVVGLWRGSKQKLEYVHRMVANAFLEPPPCRRIVNHINGVKTDNRAKNLEWCTHSENMSHARETGLIKDTKRPVYRDDGEVYESLYHAHRETGVSYGNVWKCCNGRQKKTGGHRWSYEPFKEDAI